METISLNFSVLLVSERTCLYPKAGKQVAPSLLEETQTETEVVKEREREMG